MKKFRIVKKTVVNKGEDRNLYCHNLTVNTYVKDLQISISDGIFLLIQKQQQQQQQGDNNCSLCSK